MKKILTGIALVISVVWSGWAYQNSALPLKQILVDKEWQSNVVAYPEEWAQNIAELSKIDISTSIKYLPNATYLKDSSLLLYLNDSTLEPVKLNISEVGNWELSDNYLVVTPLEFKTVAANPDKQLSSKQLEQVKILFKVSSQRSRRIDKINESALLITSLGHGSTMMTTR